MMTSAPDDTAPTAAPKPARPRRKTAEAAPVAASAPEPAPGTEPEADAPTPARQAVEEVRRGVEAARDVATHVTAAVEIGRQAIPEVADIARVALDEQVDRLKIRGQEAADVAVDQVEIARELIIAQVKARPIASALAAVGLGVVLGAVLSGRRR